MREVKFVAPVPLRRHNEAIGTARRASRHPGPEMSIAFKCPNCQQPYKVKDDMAGKRVVCTACKQPIRVPAPTAAAAVPAADADALAVAALAEAPAAPAEQSAATITVECPNCIEQVSFPADKAGKQAPCPNCKRVIKVPIPATGKKDWRTADARPTFAKVAPEAEAEGCGQHREHEDRGPRGSPRSRTIRNANANRCHCGPRSLAL